MRGARGTNLGANKLETLGLVADFSVFEDFPLRGEMSWNSSSAGVWASGVGYEERASLGFSARVEGSWQNSA